MYTVMCFGGGAHQLMRNIRFSLITANGDGLRAMVIPMKDKVANYTW